jgi:protein TonB
MSADLGTFNSYGQSTGTAQNWAGALFGSTAIYIAGGALLFVLGTATKELIVEKRADITFVEKVAIEPPPPAPEPPKPVEPPKPAPAAAPVIPKDMKVRQLDKPPPAKELAAPKEMPKEAPKEADPSQDKGIAVYGDVGKGDPAGLEGGMQGGVVGGQVGAIALPEDADPPIPAKSNATPEYPEMARAAGKMGMVILKVVILASGEVASVEVMRGDEPFVSAAVKAVKQWRYEPARFKGQAITVYRIIQIPFKLTV